MCVWATRGKAVPTSSTRTWKPKPVAGIKTGLGSQPNQKASEKGQLEPRGGTKGAEVDRGSTHSLSGMVSSCSQKTLCKETPGRGWTLHRTNKGKVRTWGSPGDPLTALLSVKLLLSLSPGLGLLSLLDVQLFLHPMEWLRYPLEYQHPWSMIRTTTESLPPLDATQLNCCWIYSGFLSWPKGAWLLFSLSTCVNLICGVFG